ncbi:hypothetical protein Tco_1475723 [Tanacetum coccineum]
MIKRSKCENKGIVPTEMELVLEYTQQGASHEVSDHLKMEMEMEIPTPPEEEAKAGRESVVKPLEGATKKRGATAGVASQKASGGKRCYRCFVATVISIYVDSEFARIKRDWMEMGCIVFYFPLDIMKFSIHQILSGKDWNTVIDNMVYEREREAQWAHAHRTLHGLQAPDALNMFNEKSIYIELSEIAEHAKRRA